MINNATEINNKIVHIKKKTGIPSKTFFFLHHSVEKRKLFEEIKKKEKIDINFISWISCI